MWPILEMEEIIYTLCSVPYNLNSSIFIGFLSATSFRRTCLHLHCEHLFALVKVQLAVKENAGNIAWGSEISGSRKQVRCDAVRSFRRSLIFLELGATH